VPEKASLEHNEKSDKMHNLTSKKFEKVENEFRAQ